MLVELSAAFLVAVEDFFRVGSNSHCFVAWHDDNAIAIGDDDISGFDKDAANHDRPIHEGDVTRWTHRWVAR